VRFQRGSEEFSRVLAFSDGMFAIAMTLLVVGIAVPELTDPSSSELLDSLEDLLPEIISFFISFAVIGRYWAAHHQFFAMLGSMDYALIAINLIYLAFVAFLPFPTALLGDYIETPAAVAIYAVAVAVVSGLEVVLFWRAYRDRLLARDMPPEVFRWGVWGSTMPVVFLLLSVPVAFIDTGVAIAVWFLSVPGGMVLNRIQPEAARDWW
jgi:uncharacterized membrane protein